MYMRQYSSTTKYHHFIIEIYITLPSKPLDSLNFSKLAQHESNSAGRCILIGVPGASLAANRHARRHESHTAVFTISFLIIKKSIRHITSPIASARGNGPFINYARRQYKAEFHGIIG